MAENIQVQFRIYEDGNLIDSYDAGPYKDYVITGTGEGYTLASRSYEGHQYTFSVKLVDTTGQYEDSDTITSGVLDNSLLDKYKAYFNAKYPDYPIGNSSSSNSSTPSSDSNSTKVCATLYYDANGGVKGEKWVDSWNAQAEGYDVWPSVGEDYIGPYNIVESDWIIDGVISAPEGMKFAGLEINGEFYAVGTTTPEILVTGDVYYKFIWTSIDGNDNTPAADSTSAGTSTVSDWNGIDDLMGKLQEAAAKGGNQSVTYYGNFALPYEVMKFLQDNPKVTLYYNVYYAEEGKTYNTKIGGKKVVADQNIPWYGPLYLASIYGTTQSASAPVTVGDGEYLIQDGDTLSSIAARLNVSVSHLVSANNIENPDLIIAGKILKY